MGSSNGATRGQLRPYLSGRTPPFLLVGLLVILGILGFSYWSLNTQFTELQSEIHKLEERLRVYAEKRETVEKMNSALQAQMQTHKEENKKFRITLYKRDQELSTIAEQLRSREEALNKASMHIDSLKSDLETYDSRDKQKELEIVSLQDQAKSLKIDNQELGDAKAELQKKFELLQKAAAYMKRKGLRNSISNSILAHEIPQRVIPSIYPDEGISQLNREIRFQPQIFVTNSYAHEDAKVQTPVPESLDVSNIDKIPVISSKIQVNEAAVGAGETSYQSHKNPFKM